MQEKPANTVPPASPADSPAEPTKGDCYSHGERAWMEYGQHLRATLLAPFLRWLDHYHVSPDHITWLSLLCGLAFVPCWYFDLKMAALLGLLSHVLLDGIDGPLARYQKVASPRGSFTDTVCDQLIVSVVAMSLMSGSQPLLGIFAGSIFMVLYVGVVSMAMVRNTLDIPYSWLVRPRFFFYLAIPLQLAGVPLAVPVVTWVSNVLLGLKTASGFIKLRSRLRGPSDPDSV